MLVFGKFGVLCFVTSVFKFTFLPYQRRIVLHVQITLTYIQITPVEI